MFSNLIKHRIFLIHCANVRGLQSLHLSKISQLATNVSKDIVLTKYFFWLFKVKFYLTTSNNVREVDGLSRWLCALYSLCFLLHSKSLEVVFHLDIRWQNLAEKQILKSWRTNAHLYWCSAGMQADIKENSTTAIWQYKIYTRNLHVL